MIRAGNQRVTDILEWDRVLDQLDTNSIDLEILRKGKKQTVTLRVRDITDGFKKLQQANVDSLCKNLPRSEPISHFQERSVSRPSICN